MDTRELAWAAGLFDGEGCISITNMRGTDVRYPVVTVAMTDLDAIERFQRAVGGLGHIRVRPREKPLYVWRAGSFEAAQAVVAMLWYGLNRRRRDRVAEVWRAVHSSQGLRRNMRRAEACLVDDCDIAVLARGLCSKHYQRARYMSA